MAWDAEQQKNANIIVSVGRSLGASERDILIGLMTAMQESELRNVNYGDRDSLGLFQQRPSMGWGTQAQVTDPVYAATTFFKGKPGNPGLFSIKNRDSLSLTQAAQKVQRSAFPDAYAKHESGARELLGLGGSTGQASSLPLPKMTEAVEAPAVPAPAATSPEGATAAMGADQTGAVGIDAAAPVGLEPDDYLPAMARDEFDAAFRGQKLPSLFTQATETPPPSTATGVRAKVVDEARKWVGVPYVWGGTSNQGWDCSGAMQWIFGRYGIDLPRLSSQQALYGKRVDVSQATAGDMIAWNNGSRNGGPEAEHIALYLGDGYVFEAPKPGTASRIRKLGDNEGDIWGVQLSY